MNPSTRHLDAGASSTTPATLLGSRLAAERHRLGLSLLAVACGLNPELDSTSLARRIHRAESGKRVDLALAQRLALAYGTTLAALMADSPIERLSLRTLARLDERQRVRAWRYLRRLAGATRRP